MSSNISFKTVFYGIKKSIKLNKFAKVVFHGADRNLFVSHGADSKFVCISRFRLKFYLFFTVPTQNFSVFHGAILFHG